MEPTLATMYQAMIDIMLASMITGQEHVLDVVTDVGSAAGHRLPAGEHIASVRARTRHHFEIEVVHQRRAGYRAEESLSRIFKIS